MPALLELLPETASGQAGITFTPVPGVPGVGVLRIDDRRSSVTYAVAEFQTPWDGRAFRLAKTNEGTDPEATSYDTFVSRLDVSDFQCTCKGFQRHRHCKHALACLALIQNGWV